MVTASKLTSWDHVAKRLHEEDRGYSSPCWIWNGPLNHAGYGRTSVPGVGKRVRIHRLAYEAFVGPIPDGLVIDHLCCVRACCNPEHLEPVTNEENLRRSLGPPCEHGSRKSSCKACLAAYMRAWSVGRPPRIRPPLRPEVRARKNARRNAMRAAGLWAR